MQAVRAFLSSPAGRFVARYVLILSGGFTVLAFRPVEQHVVNPYTTFVAHESQRALNLLGEDARVEGQVVSSPRFSVHIYNGCNGLEAMLVFACGVLAFPASWRAKVIGLVLGFAAIQVVNVVRIVSLFYVGVYKPEWFSTTHVLVWQTIVILIGVVLWLIWVQRHAQAGQAR